MENKRLREENKRMDEEDNKRAISIAELLKNVEKSDIKERYEDKLEIMIGEGISGYAPEEQLKLNGVFRSIMEKSPFNQRKASFVCCVSCNSQILVEHDHIIEIKLWNYVFNIFNEGNKKNGNGKIININQLFSLVKLINSGENHQLLCKACNIKKRNWFREIISNKAGNGAILQVPADLIENTLQRLTNQAKMEPDYRVFCFLFKMLEFVRVILANKVDISDKCFI